MIERQDHTNVKKSKAPLVFSLIVIAILVGGYFFIPAMNEFFNEAWKVLTSNDKQKIEAWVSDFGWIGPFVLIVAMIAQMFLLVIPSIALMIVSILAYGPLGGSLIVFAAIFCASSVGYFIGRYFGPIIVQKLLGVKTEHKISDFIEDYGFWAVIVTRINPFLSNDAISFVGGILKIGYWKFIGATLLGIAPLTFFIAVIGDSTQQLKTGLLWGSLISLVLFILYVYWDKQKR
ncbi:putative membrane protein YdjX (TVP38/TMEM64 family) [Salegentibacter sp. 24]|uniref:TVP38/TMEM64 family protein n=1 Tax=Salegentibacter sp. 24 TaxID=2183986 RepID=UPI001060F7A9|nr:TVP38/TMEM64 family protein [Salegentibacter sp. 24]TDN83816.1 putative membrane protein YdjX (TVP38/TMEM64 family) [Salegentibacter sp. 24]